MPVEHLRVGDRVATLDHGAQPILWAAHRALRFPPTPQGQKPIELKQNCLTPGFPRRDLVVSPHHRMLWAGVKSAARGVFVAAHCLCGLPGIRRKAGCKQVTYHTVLLPRHEIIFAEGVAVESFYPGPVGLATLAPFERLRLSAALPRFRQHGRSGYGAMARAQMPSRLARALCRSGPARIVCDATAAPTHRRSAASIGLPEASRTAL